MSSIVRFGLAVAILAAVQPAHAQERWDRGDIAVDLRAVDARGAPIPGVRFYTRIVSNAEVSKRFVSERPTDERGLYRGSIYSLTKPLVLTALSEDGKLGATARVSEYTGAEPMTVVLHPLVEVSAASFAVRGFEERTRDPWLSVHDPVDGTYIIGRSVQPRGAGGERGPLMLPPGKYDIEIVDERNSERLEREITIAPGQRLLDLGDVILEPVARLNMPGRPALDWDVSAVRGLPADVRIADFRGKWLLIDIWGFWCGPCIAEGIPKLLTIHDEYQDLADKFAIVTVHDNRAKTFDALDKELERVKARYWEGRDLPFPILLDGANKTVPKWGIRAFPTMILVDPEGKTVTLSEGAGAERELIKVLDALRKGGSR